MKTQILSNEKRCVWHCYVKGSSLRAVVLEDKQHMYILQKKTSVMNVKKLKDLLRWRLHGLYWQRGIELRDRRHSNKCFYLLDLISLHGWLGSWLLRQWHWGFESHFRHGCRCTLFCVLLSCVNRSVAQGDLISRDSSKYWTILEMCTLCSTQNLWRCSLFYRLLNAISINI
jgi:hypothetical protein